MHINVDYLQQVLIGQKPVFVRAFPANGNLLETRERTQISASSILKEVREEKRMDGVKKRRD